MAEFSEQSTVGAMPSLLELIESGELTGSWDIDRDAGVAADDGGNRTAPGLLTALALCADEGADRGAGIASLCADDGLDQGQDWTALSGLSICSDEGDDSVSDARLKADVERVGTTVYGLPLFQFRYTDGVERFEGVMAQDVLAVMPDAVSVGADGFYRVNYGKLGIAMTRA